jgi:DNA topoisomerase-1
MTVSASVTAITTAADAAAASAKAAGLRYTTDTRPGIRRVRRGRSFTYVDAEGKPLRVASELARIKALVIPPAWTGVWICPDARGHLQATGRDARGRKQYRYHPRWRQVRDETKYHRMIGFAQALPSVRRRTREDMRRTGLPREKVLATVVQLLEKTLIRVGNDEYARSNRSYGLTTMRDTHVEFKGERVRFSFRGKSGVEHEIDLNDRRLARIVKQCRDLPGYELFQYYDERGERQSVGSEEVNAYLKEVTGQDLTSKDFRTWAGTVLAAQLLRECEACSSETQAKKNIVAVVEQVAKRLGNTKAVCRKCYIHPAIFEAYLDGSMLETIAQRARKVSRAVDRLTGMERSVLSLLQRRLPATKRRRPEVNAA